MLVIEVHFDTVSRARCNVTYLIEMAGISRHLLDVPKEQAGHKEQ